MPGERSRSPSLSPSLARFLAEPSERWSLPKLWGAMPSGLRVEAVTAVLESPDYGQVAGELLDAIAAAAGFRKGTLQKMQPSEAARHAARLPGRRLPTPGAVFQAFLMNARADLLSRNLELLGVPHVGGKADDAFDGPVAPADASAAAERLFDEFPADDVVVYLVAVMLATPILAPGLDEWLPPRFDSKEGDMEAVVEPIQTEDGEEYLTPEPELIRDIRTGLRGRDSVPDTPFTVLDRALIRAAVDSQQGVSGAADRAEMEDMVDEFMGLNSSRHVSYYHRGFLDGLSGREYREALAAENEPRRRWYLAGWLAAMSRRGKREAILHRFDHDPHIDHFRGAETPEGRMVVPILFDALCREGREPEGARILTPEHLLANPTLIALLLQVGTRLLDESNVERARPFFDRLGEIMDRLEATGEDTTEPFFLEIRRRRAHCYRQLRETERARELLERLLAEETKLDLRAMVLADLGLLDTGLRSLADVGLWRSDVEKTEVIRALERGARRFREAEETRSWFASHGAWPLAVLAMGRGEWAEARDLLSIALTSFLIRPSSYRRQTLLARVKIATGIAEAMNMEYTRLPRARDLLVQGLTEGGRIHRPFLPDVLAALETHEDGLAEDLLAHVLDRQGPQVLDDLGASRAVQQTPAVAIHLLAYADDPEVGGERRARAYRRALPILLMEGSPRPEDASHVLDRLEELARSGFGREEFLELLSDPRRVAPIWSPEDVAWARIGLLEATERYEEAVGVLRGRLAEILASNRWSVELDADAIVSQARSYGLDPAWTEDMESRLTAWKREFGEPDEPLPPPRRADQPWRILIVGGDERQHALEERVRALLEAEGTPIRIHHIPTGWGGNWSKTLEESVAAAERHDALVLIRFMRTEFGRSLRSAITCPWVACSGVGVAQVARTVKQAAMFAGARSEKVG